MRAWLKENWGPILLAAGVLMLLASIQPRCELRIESKPETQPSEVRR